MSSQNNSGTSILDHVSDNLMRPWMIVGKGPSLDVLTPPELVELLGRYNLFTLNHACRFIPRDDTVSVAHFADLEAFNECRVFARGIHFCLPWWPHVANRPGRLNLGQLADQDDDLGQLRTDGLLLGYNSTIAQALPRNEALPEIRVRYFSAVAAVNILARAGVKPIYAIGVDGGKSYSTAFAGQTPLTNGRSSFDVQFTEIERACKAHKTDFVRLGIKPARGPSALDNCVSQGGRHERLV